jgi:hypothetical protein
MLGNEQNKGQWAGWFGAFGSWDIVHAKHIVTDGGPAFKSEKFRFAYYVNLSNKGLYAG